MMSNKTFLGSLIFIGVVLLIFSYTISSQDTFDNCPCNVKKDNCSKTIKEIGEEKEQDKDGKGAPCYYCSDSDEMHINVVYDGDASTDNNWDFNYLCGGDAGWKSNTLNYCSVFTWVNYDESLGYRIARTFYVWDTCSIPDNAIIKNVTFFVSYCEDNVDADEYVIVVNSSIDITDFDNLALYYHMIDKNTLLSDAYQFLAQYNNEIRIKSFDWINKEGFSQFAVIDYDYDYSCTAPGRPGNYQNINFADEHINNCYRPYLIVGYDLPCDNTTLTLYENIINATGTHQSKYNNLTGWEVWANYTGNTSGTGCTGIVWVNYSDTNLSFNVSVNKTDNSNTSSYIINEDNWLNLLTGSIMFDDSQLFLFILLTLWIYFLKEYLDKRNSPNGSMLAKIQLALAFPLTIQLAIISFSFVLGYILVFIIPVLAIYIFLDSTLYMKNNKK